MQCFKEIKQGKGLENDQDAVSHLWPLGKLVLRLLPLGQDLNKGRCEENDGKVFQLKGPSTWQGCVRYVPGAA